MPGRFRRGFGRKRGKPFGTSGWLDRFKQQHRPLLQCICPHCGHRIDKEKDKPCFKTVCPKCGSQMTRQFSSEA